jgi:hypothetical protein
VTRDRVPSSATASCASALTAPGKCRPGPTPASEAGYARNALALLIGYAASIGVTHLEAHVAPDNHASRHVAEAVGFIQAETFTDDDGTEFIRYTRDASGDGQPPSPKLGPDPSFREQYHLSPVQVKVQRVWLGMVLPKP